MVLFKMRRFHYSMNMIWVAFIFAGLIFMPLNSVLAEIFSSESDHVNYHHHIPSPAFFEDEDSMREKVLSKAKQAFIEKGVLTEPAALYMTWHATGIAFSVDGEEIRGWAVSGFEYFDVYSCFVTPSGDEAFILDTVTRSEGYSFWEAEKGSMFTWTLEDKALCGSIYIENSPHILPAEDAISQDKAVALSKQYCMDAYGLSAEVMDQFYIDPYFNSIPEFWRSWDSDPVWIICFRAGSGEDYYRLMYHVMLSTENGELIRIGTGEEP